MSVYGGVLMIHGTDRREEIVLGPTDSPTQPGVPGQAFVAPRNAETYPIELGPGCTLEGGQFANCLGVTRLIVDLQGGDDLLDMRQLALPALVNAGAGNDLLTGGSGRDTVNGGEGVDACDGTVVTLCEGGVQ